MNIYHHIHSLPLFPTMGPIRMMLTNTKTIARFYAGQDLKAAMDLVLEGKPCPPGRPSIGCNIKW